MSPIDAACEQEQLHLSGAIQPHGALLAADAEGRVTHASANCERFTGIAAARWLGQPLPAGWWQAAQRLAPQTRERSSSADHPLPDGGRADVVLHRLPDGGALVELIDCARPLAGPMPVRSGALDDPLTQQRRAVLDDLASALRCDRLIYYAFVADVDGMGDGEVVAERLHDPALQPFFGLRFPASDIPRIARRIYLENPWRAIVDATVAAEPVLGPAGAPTLDLTRSELRSVSPIHLQYMANMGVRASVSWPVRLGDELIALVTAHSRGPLNLTQSELRAAADRVELHAIREGQVRAASRMALLRRLDSDRERWIALARDGEPRDALMRGLAAWMLDLFAADGIMLVDAHGHHGTGLAIDPATVDELRARRRAGDWQTVWATSAAHLDPSEGGLALPGSETPGLLAIDLTAPGGEPIWVLVARREHVEEVAWGGRPAKAVVDVAGGAPQFSPRDSFQRWVELRRGRSVPWPADTRLRALTVRNLLLQTGAV